MPGESGLDFAHDVLADYPDTAVVMVTGADDRRHAETALAFGAYGYMLKPFKPNELLINVANALRRRALEIENREHREPLERSVLERPSTLRDTITQFESSESELRRLREETIRRLSWAAEFRNQETGEHIDRMSRYCALLARLAGLDRRAHGDDPDREPDARRRQDRHPGPHPAQARPADPRGARGDGAHAEIGHGILAGSGVELLDLAAAIALTHHERFDGNGYPRRLAATRSRSRAAIAAVADVFDALTTDRVYRQAFRPTRRAR